MLKKANFKTINCLKTIPMLSKQLSPKLKDEFSKIEVDFFSGDIDEEILDRIDEKNEIFIDTETTGLDFRTDRICKVQIFIPSLNKILLIDIKPYNSGTMFPVLHHLLVIKKNVKNFHYALLDLIFLKFKFKDDLINPYCTYFASKIIKNTGNDSFGALCKDFLDLEIQKTHQRSYWGESLEKMDIRKVEYMVLDVLLLKKIKEKITEISVYEKKCSLIQQANSLLKKITRLNYEGVDFIKFFKF